MAELQGTNKQIIDATLKESSPMVVQALEGITTSEGVYNVLSQFPTVQNEFINTLINRCVKTMFFSKVFKNPLAMLHKGMLPFGTSIQQIFTETSERKGFYEHFEESGTPENDLIGKKIPSIYVDYITENYQHKYKVTVSSLMLKKAFLNEGGLASMVNDLVMANLNGAYIDEYEDMKGILIRKTADSSTGHVYDKGLLYQYLEDTTVNKDVFINCGDDPKMICEKIRTYAKKFTFPSRKYNLSKVKTWSNTEDLIFFTTPEIEAKIDVNVLAHAFNVSNTDIKMRTIIIDELPTIADNETLPGNIMGIVADKDIIQAWDTVNESANFNNGERLWTNYFLHKHGIMASCKFANMIILHDGKGTPLA